MAPRIFSIDAEGVREVFGDLVDALDDIGLNVPKERFQDRSSNMSMFLRSVESMEPETAWTQMLDSLKKLATDSAGGDPRVAQEAVRYIQMAAMELKQCCTWEDK
jgi:hypothetical protein